jgi:hypothetical protein
MTVIRDGAADAEKPLTRDDIIRCVEHFQAQLQLYEWHLRVDWDERPSGQNAAASVQIAEDYHRATIRLEEKWANWPTEHLNRYLCHELCHVLLHRVDRANDLAVARLGDAARLIAAEAWEQAEEETVDRLAEAIAASRPYVPERDAA